MNHEPYASLLFQFRGLFDVSAFILFGVMHGCPILRFCLLFTFHFMQAFTRERSCVLSSYHNNETWQAPWVLNFG